MAKNELIKIDDKKGIMEFLQAPTVKIAEVLTGVLVSDKKDWKLSAGKLVQASLKGKLLTQIGRELKEYQKKGKIKEDYFATNKNQASLYELLKFVDDEVPDEERFKAMKSIFFSSISKEATEEDEELAYLLMQVCKQLTSADVLILKAAYEIINGKKILEEGVIHTEDNAIKWFEIIAKQIGHNVPGLVEGREDKLTELKLITPRIKKPSSYVLPMTTFERNNDFRLTLLGKKLCEFITRYD